MCANGGCVPLVWVCDADSDCGDGSDETGELCAARSCPTDEFRCGRCVLRSNDSYHATQVNHKA